MDMVLISLYVTRFAGKPHAEEEDAEAEAELMAREKQGESDTKTAN